MIEDGRYTVVYPGGSYRTLRIRVGKNSFANKTILSYKDGAQYVGIAFLDRDSGRVSFWHRFRASNPPERLQRIEKAVRTILDDPKQAQILHAMHEKSCSRCGRELTVPASLHAGLGPECARKGRWTKKDNAAVYDAVHSQAQVVQP